MEFPYSYSILFCLFLKTIIDNTAVTINNSQLTTAAQDTI